MHGGISVSPSNRLTRSLPLFSASAGFSRYVELAGYWSSAVRLGPMTVWRGLFECLLSIFLYKGNRRKVLAPHPEPHCRQRPVCRPVRSCRATGRDTDVRRTWVALRRLGPTRAPRGAFLRVLAAVELSADPRTGRRSRVSPYGRTALDWPRFDPAPDHHRTTKPFLPAKVVFAGRC